MIPLLELEHWLPFQKTQVLFPAPTFWFTTPSPLDLTYSSDLLGQQTLKWHTGKTLICLNFILIKKKKVIDVPWDIIKIY